MVINLKKLFSIITLMAVLLSCAQSAFAYNWPAITDWAGLLSEKRSMIYADDFELYVQAPTDYAPYYGARLEPKGGVYFGIVPDQYKGSVGASSYLTYFEMSGRQTMPYWPTRDMMATDDVITTVGWTVGTLDEVDYDVIREGLNNLAKYDKPIIIRFGNEMNVSSIGDDPDRYIEVFRRVANMVHEYDNFATVWSPNDLGNLERPMQYYYPGDEYVDWIGISSYIKRYFRGNAATTAEDAAYFMTGDNAWSTNAIKPVIKFMEDYGIKKPVMISEGGVSVRNRNDGDTTAWAEPRLRNMYYNLIMKYPQVKLINYFTNERNEAEVYYTPDNGTIESILSEAYNSGAYIKKCGQQAQFAYARADWTDELTADADGNIVLSTLAHVPDREKNTVTYYVDGEWRANPSDAPYKFWLNLPQLSDGEHELKIVLNSNDKEKTFKFNKSGNKMIFGEGRTVSNTQKDVSIYVYGVKVNFDVQPCIINERTMVPIRMFLNAINFTDDQIIYENGKITIDNKMRTVVLNIGSDVAYIDGNPVPLDSPAVIKDDRTLIPLRFVSENFGLSVEYNDYGSAMDIFLNDARIK